MTTAAAGLHVTSPCAICGPGFEWVSCLKGIGLVLQARTPPRACIYYRFREKRHHQRFYLINPHCVWYLEEVLNRSQSSEKRITGLYSYFEDFLALIFRVGKKKIWNFRALCLAASVGLMSCCLLFEFPMKSIIGFIGLTKWCNGFIYFICFRVSLWPSRRLKLNVFFWLNYILMHFLCVIKHECNARTH